MIKITYICNEMKFRSKFIHLQDKLHPYSKFILRIFQLNFYSIVATFYPHIKNHLTVIKMNFLNTILLFFFYQLKVSAK